MLIINKNKFNNNSKFKSKKFQDKNKIIIRNLWIHLWKKKNFKCKTYRNSSINNKKTLFNNSSNNHLHLKKNSNMILIT